MHTTQKSAPPGAAPPPPRPPLSPPSRGARCPCAPRPGQGRDQYRCGTPEDRCWKGACLCNQLIAADGTRGRRRRRRAAAAAAAPRRAAAAAAAAAAVSSVLRTRRGASPLPPSELGSHLAVTDRTLDAHKNGSGRGTLGLGLKMSNKHIAANDGNTKL
ncbi:Protein of unknown function [Gryllus bimaculatus]|nr:Protein of unknown function [Gryllus bimaculatus]